MAPEGARAHREISENIARRNLTPGQRAAVADKLANLDNGSNRYQKLGVGIPIPTPISREEAAERVGTTPQAISEFRVVKEWAAPAAKAIESGKLFWTRIV